MVLFILSTLDKNVSLPECIMSGTAVDYREMACRNMREKTEAESVFQGKVDSQGGTVVLLSHAQGLRLSL